MREAFLGMVVTGEGTTAYAEVILMLCKAVIAARRPTAWRTADSHVMRTKVADLIVVFAERALRQMLSVALSAQILLPSKLVINGAVVGTTVRAE